MSKSNVILCNLNFLFCRFGYVDVETREDLEAVVALSGETLEGEVLRIEEAKPKGSSPDKSKQSGDQTPSWQRKSSGKYSSWHCEMSTEKFLNLIVKII